MRQRLSINFEQAETQSDQSGAKCAQCQNCRAVNLEKNCERLYFCKRIVTHCLVMGNIMQVWDIVKLALQSRTFSKRSAIQILRCNINGGVFVGLEVPNEVVEKLEELLKERTRIQNSSVTNSSIRVASKMERCPLQNLLVENHTSSLLRPKVEKYEKE